MAHPHYPWWKYGRALAFPLLLWGLVVASLWEPVRVWLGTGRGYDRASLREWLEEARNGRTLPELAEDYLRLSDRLAELLQPAEQAEKEIKQLKRSSLDHRARIRQLQEIAARASAAAAPVDKALSEQRE